MQQRRDLEIEIMSRTVRLQMSADHFVSLEPSMRDHVRRQRVGIDNASAAMLDRIAQSLELPVPADFFYAGEEPLDHASTMGLFQAINALDPAVLFDHLGALDDDWDESDEDVEGWMSILHQVAEVAEQSHEYEIPLVVT